MNERMSQLEWETARRVCTPKQIAALDVWRRGGGKRRIGLVMGVDPSTAKEHVDRGLKRVTDELDRIAA